MEKNTGKVREFCRSGKVGTMTETRWTQLQNNDTYYWSEASLADYYCRYVPGCCTQRSLYRNLRGAGNERQRSKGLPRKRHDQQWSVSLVNASTKGNTVKSTPPHTHKKPWEPRDIHLNFVNSAIRTSIVRPPVISDHSLGQSLAHLWAFHWSPVWCFVGVMHAVNNVNKVIAPALIGKVGLWNIPYENETKCTEARIERPNIILHKIVWKQVITGSHLLF